MVLRDAGTGATVSVFGWGADAGEEGGKRGEVGGSCGSVEVGRGKEARYKAFVVEVGPRCGLIFLVLHSYYSIPVRLSDL